MYDKELFENFILRMFKALRNPEEKNTLRSKEYVTHFDKLVNRMCLTTDPLKNEDIDRFFEIMVTLEVHSRELKLNNSY